jgi:integrase
MRSNGQKPVWEPTGVQNLIRHSSTGTYYARLRIAGKLISKSLKTKVLSVAKLRLPDEKKKHLEIHEKRQALGDGKMTVGDVIHVYREKLETSPGLKPRTKDYYVMILKFITKSWPSLEAMDISKATDRDCEEWLVKFRKNYAPSVVNNSIAVLRAIFKEAILAGARYGNPAADLKRSKLRPKKLKLPTRREFLKFVQAIETGGSRDSKNCADLVRFLSYSGMRVGESKHAAWRDIDFEKKKLHVRGDPVTGTKNSETRMVPLIPELESMLQTMRDERADESLDTPIMQVHECQKSMDRAATIVGMERITHHDLRHLFATICIESGVDIPTVSRWLGHKDGGALCMKTYGHLRDEHSAAQAQRVSFSETSVKS